MYQTNDLLEYLVFHRLSRTQDHPWKLLHYPHRSRLRSPSVNISLFLLLTKYLDSRPWLGSIDKQLLARLFRFKSLTYRCEPVPPIKKRLPFICDLKLPIQCSFRFVIPSYKLRLAVHPPKRLGLTVSSAKSRAVPCNRERTKHCVVKRGDMRNSIR